MSMPDYTFVYQLRSIWTKVVLTYFTLAEVVYLQLTKSSDYVFLRDRKPQISVLLIYSWLLRKLRAVIYLSIFVPQRGVPYIFELKEPNRRVINAQTGMLLDVTDINCVISAQSQK